MDNKITKNRLSDMFAYEWIIIAAVILAAIFLLEFFYSMFSVKLTTGQQFRIIYDINVSDKNSEDLENLFVGDNAFSFDVLEFASEKADDTGNVLSARNILGIGDVIITDSVKAETEGAKSRSEAIYYAFKMYSIDKLLSDAENYLQSLKSDSSESLSYDDLDEELITKGFNDRLKGDNRFRTEEEKASGIVLEMQRIKKLTETYADLKELVSLDDLKRANGEEPIFYTIEIENESPVRCGINAKALSGGKNPASRYFYIDGDRISAENVVIMFFDRYKDTSDYKGKGALQFETLNFISVVVRECSSLLSERT